MITSRPATLSDFRRFYGKEPHTTLKAIVVESSDNEIMGFGGYHIYGDVGIAFSDHNPEMSRKDVVRAARALHQFLIKVPVPIFAEPPTQAYGDTAMRHFGFVPVGGVYRMEKD